MGGLVGALFGGGQKSPPPPKAVSPIPTQSSADVQAAADAERQRAALAYGRSSTILGSADTTAAPNAQRTLLGSGG